MFRAHPVLAILFFCLLTPLSACIGDDEALDDMDTNPSPDVAILVGDGVLEPDVSQPDQPICGEGSTIVQYVTWTGSTMTFCAYGEGGVAVSETGRMDEPQRRGHAIAMPDRPQCVLDVFLATAPAELPIPGMLHEACDREQPRSGEGLDEEDNDLQGTYVSKAHFCGANGATEFAKDISDGGKCFDWWDYNGYRRQRYCYAGLYSSHTRSMQGQIDTYGNVARESLASCNGTSLHKISVSGGSTGCASCVIGSQSVGAGYWNTWHYDCPGSLDCNVQFNGSKISGSAGHRFGGYFIDWHWP